MDNFLQLLTTPELWIALLGGGGLLKIIEFLIKRSFDRETVRISTDQQEKDSLREDIEYLRQEVAGLRGEVAEMKSVLQEKDEQISSWQRRYWEVSAALDRLIIFLRYNASPKTREQAWPIIKALEEGGIVELDTKEE